MKNELGKIELKREIGLFSIGLLSVLSAMIVTGPRVYYAMAKDGVFFENIGNVSRFGRTPGNAIFLQASIAIVMVLTTSFGNLLIYIGFTLSLFAVLTVLGMIRLRVKQPHIQRSYKTFGYPVTPIVFIAGNLWIVYFSIVNRLAASLSGLATIGLGILVFMYFKKKRNHCREIHQKTPLQVKPLLYI